MSMIRTAFALALSLFVAAVAKPAVAAPADSDAQAALKEIKDAFGLVPGFIKAFPEEGLAPAWSEMKGLQMGKTVLSGKEKELVGLAVAAQIPCRYCIYAHTEFAKLNGASEREIGEALLMAALTRQFSTVLNGLAVDEAGFRADLEKAMAYAGQKHEAAPVAVTDAASARRDITNTFGFVPGFINAIPDGALAGAWLGMKRVQLNPGTALTGKVKELIGLGVAAQVPCHYCIAAHTMFAKANGATEAELKEAVGMAALTRHFSTVLNGTQIDEAQFRRDIDQVVRNARAKMASR
jgi:AhpD family alkylhydroperoxidase